MTMSLNIKQRINESGDIFAMNEGSESWTSPFESPTMNIIVQVKIEFSDSNILCSADKGSEGNCLSTLLAKLEERNKYLLDSLDHKEKALNALIEVNSNLSNELKRNEVMRLSQLESLALRNVELEKQISKFKTIQ